MVYFLLNYMNGPQMNEFMIGINFLLSFTHIFVVPNTKKNNWIYLGIRLGSFFLIFVFRSLLASRAHLNELNSSNGNQPPFWFKYVYIPIAKVSKCQWTKVGPRLSNKNPINGNLKMDLSSVCEAYDRDFDRSYQSGFNSNVNVVRCIRTDNRIRRALFNFDILI